jgi:hypothetical protein
VNERFFYRTISGMNVPNIKHEACIVLRAYPLNGFQLFRQQGDTNIAARKKLFLGEAGEADETPGRVLQLCMAWTHSEEKISVTNSTRQLSMEGTDLREAENSARIGKGAPCFFIVAAQ